MNDNSVDLINKVVSLAKDDKNESKSTTLYGTVKKDGDKTYVRIDGSDILTPCTSTINVEQDERVRVVITNHEAIIVGNLTSVGARQKDVDTAKEEVIAELDERVENSLTAYEEKLKAMNELAANTLGFYYTEEKDENGATIAYRHDQPTLEGSTVIYKSGIDGFFLSTDGGNSWKAGFDSNGDAVLNILYAIGIQAKWINTRGFSAIDNEGKETFRIDEETGKVYIDASEFFLGDKAIMDAINGFDPNMEMSKSGNTLTISFVDKNGVKQTYTVKDGADGKDGKDGEDGSSESLSSYQIWQLLLQTNTDFIYRGSDNALYIKASHIDTGDLCGWTFDRSSGKIYAYPINFTDSEDDSDFSAPNSSYYVELNGKSSKIKTQIKNQYTQSGSSRNYAAMTGDSLYANTLFCYEYRNPAFFTNKFRANKGVCFSGISTGSGSDLVITASNPITPSIGSSVLRKASSSKRYKDHQSFMEAKDVEKLYDLRPVYFKYKEGYLVNGDADENRSIPGFYAELVDKYFPEAVRYNSKGQPEDWDPKKMLPAVLKLIQDQKCMIDRLETENEELKKRLDKIEEKLGI